MAAREVRDYVISLEIRTGGAFAAPVTGFSGCISFPVRRKYGLARGKIPLT
jgi:hypothetical protein